MTRTQIRRNLMRRIAERTALRIAGANTELTFLQRYFSNVMAEVADENVRDTRLLLLGRDISIRPRHLV